MCRCCRDEPSQVLNFCFSSRLGFHHSQKYPKVLVSTIHRFKGGERDVVFVARFNEGFMPVAAKTEALDDEGRLQKSKLSRFDPGYPLHLAEERRLAHVAFSRARRRLVIT